MFTRESKIILLITGLSHFAVHYGMLVFPAVRLVLKAEFGADLDVLGWVGGVSGFMFGLGAIPAGWLENKLGGRKLLLICQVGIAVAGGVAFLSRDLLQLTGSLFLLGFFASIYHPAGLTLISKRIRQISRAMAYHGIAGSGGLAAGWVVAAWFAANISWRAAYGAMALFFLILALTTAILIPSRKGASAQEEVLHAGATRVRPLMIYYAIVIVVGLSFYGLNYLPVHFSRNSGTVMANMDAVFRMGLLTTFVFMAGALGQIIGGKMGDRFNRAKLLPWILLGNIPLLIAVGYTSGYWLLAFSIGAGVVFFAFQPIGNSLIADYTKSPARGLGYGVSFFFSFGAGSFAEPMGGYIAVNHGVEMIYLLMAILLTLAFIIALYLRRVSILSG